MPRWNSFIHFLQEVQQVLDAEKRQQMVDELLRERPVWPWVEERRATFAYFDPEVHQMALSMDIIENDPPFVPMVNLEGTSFWYIQRRFEGDDLLDYLLVIDDPMTPLRTERDLAGRIRRHWRVDERNPIRIATTQMQTSVLRMPNARPFPDWTAMKNVPRGRVTEHEFGSVQMGFENRKVWVYTPPDYDANPDKDYPLLVLFDGQWMIGPMQIPAIADALIKHNRMEPAIIAMKQSGNQADRLKDYISNDKHYTAVLTELLPLLQAQYRLDPVNLGLGGVGEGAVAAAHAALKNPAVFNHLIMLSPPLGRGPAQKQLAEYAGRFRSSRMLPRRIFQSVGRYEMPGRFLQPGLDLANILQERELNRGDVNYKFVEAASGHGLMAFRSVFPEALAHTFPVEEETV